MEDLPSVTAMGLLGNLQWNELLSPPHWQPDVLEKRKVAPKSRQDRTYSQSYPSNIKACGSPLCMSWALSVQQPASQLLMGSAPCCWQAAGPPTVPSPLRLSCVHAPGRMDGSSALKPLKSDIYRWSGCVFLQKGMQCMCINVYFECLLVLQQLKEVVLKKSKLPGFHKE